MAHLLKQEREADKAQFDELWSRTNVQQRRAEGLTWYPVAIRDTEMGKGDYLTVSLERTTHTDISHQFRFGGAVTLFSQHQLATDRLDGIIAHISGNTMKVGFRIDELPDWASDGKLGIDAAFDDNSYEEMRRALHQADALREKREEGALIHILTGTSEPGWLPAASIGANRTLNDSQEAAIQKMVTAEHLALLHGPPGTGKTTTLVEAINRIYQANQQTVLVVAPSNAAVDLLTEKLHSTGLTVLRIGNPIRISTELQALSLDEKLAVHPLMKELRKLRKRADEFRSMAHKYKRQFGKAEREQRQALFKEARSIMQEVDRSMQYMTNDILDNTAVITATLVGAAHFTIAQRKFHTIVVDEAAQALEPALWIPILKGKKLIMAGDHQQLAPTIKSEVAAAGGLANTLFEKLVQRFPECVAMLDTQYRMHQKIMHYSNRQFYNERLHAAEPNADHLVFEGDEPIQFIDTAGCGFEEKQVGTSTSNPEEAAFLSKQLRSYLSNIAQQPLSIGIIAPYKEQLSEIKRALETAEVPSAFQMTVNTVDSFQGQERDIIYISMTRSNNDSKIGFLSELRRMNVAMTRARKKLVIIGDSGTLAQHRFYNELIAYTESIGGYHSAWEWL